MSYENNSRGEYMEIRYANEKNRFTDMEQLGLEEIIYVYSRHLATNEKKIVTG